VERVWGAVEVELPERLAETVLGMLGAACLGAELRTTAAEQGRLVAYFGTPAEAGAAGRVIAELLRGQGLPAAACGLRVERVEDGRWVERYQAALRPLPLGRRFLVDPGGSSGATHGRIRIGLVPGRAFGTGEHATTRLCAAALERHVSAGSRWSDVGCGSGILALVARHCGAAEVLAVDVDPEAVRVAREVVRRNDAAAAVRVEPGSHDVLSPGAWDGLVANVAASYFLESAGSLIDRLRPGGRLISSGFLATEREAVLAALVRAGLIELEQEASEGWSALVLRRPEARFGTAS
jgi:ribosomal protein L11 methyltransferase